MSRDGYLPPGVEQEDIDRHLAGDEPYPDDDDVPRCRVCGCTDEEACPGGCIWAAPDLCSKCANAEDESDRIYEESRFGSEPDIEW